MSRHFLAASLAAFTATVGAAERPNILFIFTDDHSPRAIGAYGGWLEGVDPTPQIDRLAASGMLFRNSFCTNSICGPSRAVVLTGKHSHINGFRKNGDRFNPKQWIFPRELQGAGYQTAIIGKWHLGCEPEGFDHWCVLPGQGQYYNPRFKTPDGPIEVEGHCTQIVTDMALEWLEARDADKPFLLMCQHKAPHRNWMPDPRDLGLWADEDLPEPDSLFDDFADNASGARQVEMSVETHLHPNSDLFLNATPNSAENGANSIDPSGERNLGRMTDEQRAAWDQALTEGNRRFNEASPSGDQRTRMKYQRYLKNYLRSIRGVDRSVGQLLDFLEENGLADNTIVVYSSDQGFYLGEHGWYDKRWMYEPSLKMPLIVRWPGVTMPGAVVEDLVQNLDYAPTLLAAAGVEAPAPVQGSSLEPILAGESPADWRESIYYHYHAYPDIHNVPRHNGVRTDRYKLIHMYQLQEWELYDLQTDPNEMTNLYGQPEYEAITAELKAELSRLVAKYEDNSDFSPLPEQATEVVQ